MVNETFDVGAPIFELNFDNPKDQKPRTSLQRSSSGERFSKGSQHDGPLTVAFDTLPKSAENLSWKFFEQVSSLDNELRNDDEPVNGCQLVTSSRNIALDDHTTLNGHAEQLYSADTLNKSNGFMPGATNKLSSQHSPDLIQHQPKNATFQFTSPTATFKRKKQQQQQQQHQQQQQLNNNYNSKNKNQLLAPYEHHNHNHHHQNSTTSCKSESGGSNCIANQTSTFRLSAIPQEQQQQKQQRRHNNANNNDADNNDDDVNDVATRVMISSGNASVIINTNAEATVGTGISIGTGVGVGAGAGTTHSLKTRTLPAVSVARATTYATTAADASAAAKTGDNHNDDDEEEITKSRVHNRSRAQKRALAVARNRNERNKRSMGATLQHSADSFVDGIEQHFSLIGWRKKCLYTLLVLLLVLVVINLILTLWILKVMEFSPDGMGLLKIIPNGLQLTGQAMIMDMLRVSAIRSRHGQPLLFESSRNISINTRDTNGMLENHLFLGHDKLECFSTGFRINDTAGKNLFSVNRNEVTIGAHALRIDGEGGAIFRESIQTPHVRAEAGRELRLESPTRQLQMTAARDIYLQSRAGGIELSALEDVKLSTLDGSLRFESTKILMPNLRTAQPPIPGTAQSREHLHRVFQLCACSNGKLFLAAAHSICAGDDSTVCR